MGWWLRVCEVGGAERDGGDGFGGKVVDGGEWQVAGASFGRRRCYWSGNCLDVWSGNHRWTIGEWGGGCQFVKLVVLREVGRRFCWQVAVLEDGDVIGV